VPEELKIRVSFDIEGDLARAFVDELSGIMKQTGSSAAASKSAVGRAALVEYLNRRGYNVENSTASWGGPRNIDEQEDPEVVAVASPV
jgi:hypothetical protein